jgi:hypothetical protein
LFKSGVVCVDTQEKANKTAGSARIKPYYEFGRKVALATIQQAIGSSAPRRITVTCATALKDSINQSASDGVRYFRY